MVCINTILAAAESSPSGAFGTWDLILFCVAVVGVIWLGIWKAREPKAAEGSEGDKEEKGAADYFLAGRGLTWWLVGFSLIAANISTEQFVGMSGQAADWLGMAIASYEWLAAITLVVVAFCFLPKLLRGGVYTIPEFLEYRFSPLARTLMALATLAVLVGVPTASVIYSGSKVISVFFQGYSLMGLDFGSLTLGCAIIAFCGAVYVFVGGLKACAWTDLIWGAALIVGGGVVAYLVVNQLATADAQMLWDTRAAGATHSAADIQSAGIWDRFQYLNSDSLSGANGVGDKLHMVRPADDPAIPWTALMIGLWIPNFFYWGLNQYIMQRTLASKSLAEGQKGIVFAAFLKLLIPFLVVIPGILAYNLYSGDLRSEGVKKNFESGNLAAFVSLEEYGKSIAKDGLSISGIDQKKITNELKDVTNKIIPVTPQFVALHPDISEKIITHNLETIRGEKAPQQTQNSAKYAEGKAKIKSEFDKIHADFADASTNRSQRVALAEDVTKWNDDLLKEMETASKSGLTVAGAAVAITKGNKLVGYDFDAAFPTLLKNLLRPGLSWFVLAALFGAVVSSLASMLNSASTIFTMDIYHKLRRQAAPGELVKVGKIGVVVCVVIAFVISLQLGNPKFGGIFTFVQEFQGFISPGALCVFLFGFFVPKCPRFFGWFGIALNVVLYSVFLLWFSDIAFLNRMAICFGIIAAIGIVSTIVNALNGGKAIVLPVNNKVNIESSSSTKIYGVLVVVATVILYYIFW